MFPADAQAESAVTLENMIGQEARQSVTDQPLDVLFLSPQRR
jgi:hypothetical protein